VITLQEFYYPASDSRTSTVISNTHLTGPPHALDEPLTVTVLL